MQHSKELQQFYNDLHQWIINPHTDSVFSTAVGICTNLQEWCNTQPHLRVYPLLKELQEQFIQAKLDDTLPFNTSHHDYKYETKYENRARLAWIKQHSTLNETST